MIPIIWIKSLFGWIKIKIDSATRGATGLSSVEGVFRNHDGSAIASFTTLLGVGFAFEAELLAVVIAISKVALFYPALIWIECDSSYVVSLL